MIILSAGLVPSWYTITARAAQNSRETPPAGVVSKGLMMLAEKGPIGSDFTSVSIDWKGGAYYMIVNPRRGERWKLMFCPPIGNQNWRIKMLNPGKQRGSSNLRMPIASEQQEAWMASRATWSRYFAIAFAQLPPLYASAAKFQVRLVPEPNQIRFFLEIQGPPAFIVFTLNPSGKIVILDRGF